MDILAGYKDFYFHPVKRLGIDSMIMSDAPAGIASWGIHGPYLTAQLKSAS